MTLSAPTATLGSPSPEYISPIHADYYNVSDDAGWPVASLIVLLDRQRDPVRAEVHLYEELDDDVRQDAFRKARSLLEQRYYSNEPVPLKIFQAYLGRETVQVQTTGLYRLAGESQRWYQRWQVAAAAGILVFLVALVWAASSFLGGGSNPPSTVDEQASAPLESANTTNIADTAAASVALTETNNLLPPSQHADPNLAVGMRARVRPGLRLALVANPGADQEVVGYLQALDEATIIDGPVLTQGTSDTIVWWRVQLSDNSSAWAPANTSEGPVLELAQ
jgi:hypothetical protein